MSFQLPSGSVWPLISQHYTLLFSDGITSLEDKGSIIERWGSISPTYLLDPLLLTMQFQM